MDRWVDVFSFLFIDRGGGMALLPARVSQREGLTDLFPTNVDVVGCGVGEADVDEEGEGGEEFGCGSR